MRLWLPLCFAPSVPLSLTLSPPYAGGGNYLGNHHRLGRTSTYLNLIKHPLSPNAFGERVRERGNNMNLFIHY